MPATPDHQPCRSRRTRLVLLAAAVRGTCAVVARALVDWLLDLF